MSEGFCKFCERPTEFQLVGLGFLCPQCLGKYEKKGFPRCPYCDVQIPFKKRDFVICWNCEHHIDIDDAIQPEG